MELDLSSGIDCFMGVAHFVNEAVMFIMFILLLCSGRLGTFRSCNIVPLSRYSILLNAVVFYLVSKPTSQLSHVIPRLIIYSNGK